MELVIGIAALLTLVGGLFVAVYGYYRNSFDAAVIAALMLSVSIWTLVVH